MFLGAWLWDPRWIRRISWLFKFWCKSVRQFVITYLWFQCIQEENTWISDPFETDLSFTTWPPPPVKHMHLLWGSQSLKAGCQFCSETVLIFNLIGVNVEALAHTRARHLRVQPFPSQEFLQKNKKPTARDLSMWVSHGFTLQRYPQVKTSSPCMLQTIETIRLLWIERMITIRSLTSTRIFVRLVCQQSDTKIDIWVAAVGSTNKPWGKANWRACWRCKVQRQGQMTWWLGQSGLRPNSTIWFESADWCCFYSALAGQVHACKSGVAGGSAKAAGSSHQVTINTEFSNV